MKNAESRNGASCVNALDGGFRIKAFLNKSTALMTCLVLVMVSFISLHTIADPSEWWLDVVDNPNSDTDDVGYGSSLALDSRGWPHISYHDNTNMDLLYIRWEAGGWSDPEIVDPNGGNLQYTSIAIDSNDIPHISYYDPVNDQLRYAIRSGDPGCPDDPWCHEVVGPLGGTDEGRFSSLTLDQNAIPHIAYHNTMDLQSVLLYAKRAEVPNCDHQLGPWCIEEADTESNPAFSTAIGLDNSGIPHIAYYDQSETRDLKYAVRLEGQGCADDPWCIEIVDDLDDAGWDVSMVLDSSDIPHLSYQRRGTGYRALVYAVRLDGQGCNPWCIEDVDSDSAPGTGRFSSIDLDSNEIPHISYIGEPSIDLKFAERVEDPQCDDYPWCTEVVDDTLIQDQTSLALDSNDCPHISYREWLPDGDLKYATCPNEPPVSDPNGPYFGEEGSPVIFDGAGSYDPDGEIISYLWEFEPGITGSGPSPSHTYGKAGVYTITLTVTDDRGWQDTNWTSATIENVAPIVTANINTHSVNEGSPFIVDGSFDDPSWNDTFNMVRWDFGYDDTTQGKSRYQYPIYEPPTGEVHHEVLPIEWTYGDDGTYTILLEAEDEFGGQGSDTEWITVENLPPVIDGVTVIIHQNAPRTHGYWKYQCKVKNPNEEHPGIRQEWVDAIRQQSTVFTDVYDKDDVCNYLKPKNPDHMDNAKKQLMALWLNVVSGLLWIDSPLHHPNAPTDLSVREFIEHAEALILDPGVTTEELTWVNEIASEINEDADDIEPDYEFIDPVVGEYFAYISDPGTDDLMIVWNDGLTNIIVHYQYNEFSPDPYYDPNLNQVKSPEETYPFIIVDRLVVGYDETSGNTFNAAVVCVRDDDGGVTPDPPTPECPEWGSGGGYQGGNPDDLTIDWAFTYTLTYTTITGGFEVAEVDTYFIRYDPLVEPIITGGRFE